MDANAIELLRHFLFGILGAVLTELTRLVRNYIKDHGGTGEPFK